MQAWTRTLPLDLAPTFGFRPPLDVIPLVKHPLQPRDPGGIVGGNPAGQFQGGVLGGGAWREVLNSDASVFGGNGVGNAGAPVHPGGGHLAVVIPANAVVVFARE